MLAAHEQPLRAGRGRLLYVTSRGLITACQVHLSYSQLTIPDGSSYRILERFLDLSNVTLGGFMLQFYRLWF